MFRCEGKPAWFKIVQVQIGAETKEKTSQVDIVKEKAIETQMEVAI